jgi:hypothetical protein
VIVVVGLPAYVGSADGEGTAGGLAVDVAVAARERGSKVELVGKVGDDGAGDAVVVALGRLGVGHAALLRDPARPTPVLAPLPASAPETEAGEPQAGEAAVGDIAEPAQEEEALALLPAEPAARPALEAADVELALRYVSGASVVVVAGELAEAAVAAAVDGAAYSGARLVVLVAPGKTAQGKTARALPAEATVLEAPLRDDGSFGRLVGAFAAGLDAGRGPGLAFSQAVEASGWEAVQE